MGAIETVGGVMGSAGMNIATGMISNAMGQNNVATNNAMELQSNKEMTNYNMQKQLELWEKTGYGAQMKQLDKAGLNPALIYGKGGAGGSTSLATSNMNAKGNQPNIAPPSMEIGQQLMNMKAQEELTRAQIDATNAQKVKTEAETPKINEETTNLKYKNTVDKQTTDTEIGKRKNEEAIGFQEVLGKTRENAFESEAYRAKQQTIVAELNNKVFENTLMRSTNAKIQTEIPNIKEELTSIILKRILDTRNTNINEQKMLIQQTDEEIKRTIERAKLSQEETKMYIDAIKGIGQAALLKGR